MTENELSSTQKVVRRLDKHAKPEADKLAQVAIESGRYDEELDYEDWVTPLKLTGGKVCLEVEDEFEEGFESYYQMRSDTLHNHPTFSQTVVGATAVDRLRYDMRVDSRSIRPVPVEETPFMDGEDDG